MPAWKQMAQHPWLQHGAFWTLATYVLFRVFNEDPNYVMTDLIYTVLFQLSLWCVVYFQLWLLIPKFLKSGRYFLYLLGVIFSLYFGVFLNQLTFDYLADWLFPGYYFISYYEHSELLQFMLIFAAAATLLKLSKSWFDLRNNEQLINRLEREKLDAELQALRAQLDPHFLFNSLNNVYSLALDADDKVPTYLLRLSDNLRYMLYECKSTLVPLRKELEYIENYLALQRLKVDPKVAIEMTIEGSVAEQQVAPLLFIPFIENSFKHGLRGKPRNALIRMQFILGTEQLDFHISNTLPEHPPVPVEEVKKAGGIGLENVRKRLQLIYPDRHKLQLEKKNGKFAVHLRMQL